MNPINNKQFLEKLREFHLENEEQIKEINSLWIDAGNKEEEDSLGKFLRLSQEIWSKMNDLNRTK